MNKLTKHPRDSMLGLEDYWMAEASRWFENAINCDDPDKVAVYTANHTTCLEIAEVYALAARKLAKIR